MSRALAPLLLLAALGGPLAAQPEETQPTQKPASGEPSFVHDPDVAPAQWGRGPFEVQDPYVLALYRARPWATSPELPPHFGVELALRGLWANSYAFERDRFCIDAETRHAYLSARMGILDRFAIGAQLEYQWRGGGGLDAFIEDFHDAFSLPKADRRRRPHDRYLVTGLRADGRTFVSTARKGYGTSDLVVEARGQALQGGPLLPALTVTLRLRLPTGSGRFELSDGVDPTLQVDMSKRLGRTPLILYAGAAYTYHAEGSLDGLLLHRHRAFGYLGAELELGKVSLVAHVWAESPRERKLWRDGPNIKATKLIVGNAISYVAFGVKVEPLEGLTLEVGALENIVDPEVTADLGLMFNITLRL
ncbi:MAG: DUF3187 family protein [Planctomycetota bacterium]